MIGASQVLSEIASRLKGTRSSSLRSSAVDLLSHREMIQSVCSKAQALQNNPPSASELASFLREVHDLHVRADTAVRGALMRVVRLSVETAAHLQAIVQEEWQYLIVSSLEREQALDKDQDFLLLERMQALKLIKKCIGAVGNEPEEDAPSSSSSSSRNNLLSFAQSLVAVASHKGDGLRRVALETLRELSIVRPRIVAVVNGFTVLMESIFDPSNADMNDAIILSFLFVLNDPRSRRFVRPYLDLRTLIAPLTDLDFSLDDGTTSYRWKVAKAALVTVMRSWVGVIQITSDDLGLPTLIRMLRDIKVSATIQHTILDTISEVFKPFSSTVQSAGISKPRYACRDGASGDAAAGVALTSKAKRSVSGSSVSSSSSSTTTATSTADSRSTSSLGFSRTHVASSFSSLGGGGGGGNGSGGDTSSKSDTQQGSKSMTALLTGFFNSAKSMASPAPKQPPGGAPPAKRSSILNFASSVSSKPDGNVTFIRASETASRASLRHVQSDPGSKLARKDISESDPLFNALGSYSALLCCAFIHAEIIDSLCFLGVHGEVSIATKSRLLLVEILRIVARIFPEERCAELLTVPSLIEFAAAASEKTMANRAHKASQILSLLADAFTVLPAKSSAGKDNGLAKIFAQQAARQRTSSTGGRGALESAFMHQGTSGSPASSPRGQGGASSGGAGGGGGGGDSISFPAHQPPVSSMWDLCDEMQWIGQSKDHGRNSVSVAKSDVMQELRLIMTSTVDRNDFTRQMDLSRVIGKEGKEPFRWDWPIIKDMLEYSFQHPERLVEAMRSKWMKRVSGFYRCTNDEKGFFASLSWDASNLHYLECACSMYHVLVEDPQGLSFLRSDRRGILFNEISKELKDLYDCSMRQYGMSTYQKNVFRLAACQQTMAREYFSLLGRVTLVDTGRVLLDETPLVFTLSLLGTSRPLDYISRIAVTSLVFTDHGYMSQLLIKSWWASGKCSAELKAFILGLFRVLVYARPGNFRDWGVDVVVAILAMEDPQVPAPWTSLLTNLVEEMTESKANIVAFLARSPSLAVLKVMPRVLVRLLSVPEGVVFLAQMAPDAAEMTPAPLSALLSSWREQHCREYVRKVDSLLVKALSGQATTGMMLSSVKPIVVPVDDLTQLSSSVQGGDQSSSGTPGGPPVSCPQESLQSAKVNLEGLLRVPWNIDVKLVSQATYGVANSAPEYVKLDCFVDTSDISSPVCSEVTCDANRLVKIRAVVLDDKGLPSGRAITSNKTIMSCLLAGVAPVSRDGQIYPMGFCDPRSARRKSATLMHARDSMTTITKRQSVQGPPVEATSDSSDAPITSAYESQSYDWSSCKPGHRQGKVVELGENKYSVEITGEPCVWIFSRVMPGTSSTPRARTGSLGNVFMDQGNALFGSSSRSDASRSGVNTYLVEVVYYVRVETGQAIFATLPRHLYGELARSHDGLQALVADDVVQDLLATVRRRGISTAEMRSALWGLGHLASTEFGYAALVAKEPSLVEWLVNGALGHANFSVRGTFFQVLGLVSRTPAGARALLQQQWDCSVQGSCFAVSVPRNPGALFVKETQEFDATVLADGLPLKMPQLTLFLPSGSDTDLEVLNLIAKLPGLNQSLLENKARLDRLRFAHPEIFARRELYVAVHNLLETNYYRLTTRRYITKLFSASAKCHSSK